MKYTRSALLALLAGIPASAQVLTLSPSADNTMFINNADPATQLSSGSGSGVFCGRTFIHADIISRGLMRFDVSAIPPGATITSVSLTMELVSASPQGNPYPVSLHRALASWGEGGSAAFGGQGSPSQSGDASWLYRSFSTTLWTTPGGDFNPTASATIVVPAIPGEITWPSSPALIADVTAWVNNPASNSGWLLHGDETVNGSARRFASREETESAPRLRIVVASCYPNCDGSTIPPALNVQDFACFLNRFASGETYANCDGSTIPPVLNVQDFSCFLNAFASGCS